MIPAERAARVILKLRREVRAFGILGDQNPRKKDEKYWAMFMGVETPVVIGPERIAKLTGYPMFYIATERTARGHYRIVVTPLSEAPYAGEGEISQVYMRAVEAHIRAQPESWMWSHHRWRYSRVDCP
jgi:KDO2-lipid IV(A) lauroyltransferase